MKTTAPLFLLLFISIACSKKDVFISEIENSFSIAFSKTLGGSNNDTANSIIATADNGYIVLGHTQSLDNDVIDKLDSSYDYWIVKFNENDQLVWSKTFGGSDDDRGTEIIEDTNGNFIATGFSKSTDGNISQNNGSYDFWVFKIDPNGTLLWEKSFGFSGSDQSYLIKKTSDGGFLLGGSLDVSASGGQGNSKTASKHSGGDYWLIKIDTNGNKQWSKYYGGQFTDTLFDLVETENGNFILVGSSDSYDVDITNNIGSYDFWIVKINATGSIIWQKNYGGEQADEAYSIIKTIDNNFIITGNSRSFDTNVSNNYGSSDVWTIKINTEGNLIWEQNYGGSSFDEAKKIIPSINGGFYIVGSSRSFDFDVTNNYGNKDVWVIKLNSSGTIDWQKSIGGTGLDEGNSIVEKPNGSLLIVGESWSSDNDIIENKGFSDALLIKLTK